MPPGRTRRRVLAGWRNERRRSGRERALWIDDNSMTYAGINTSTDNAYNCCENGSGC